jgi:hypothetical protein
MTIDCLAALEEGQRSAGSRDGLSALLPGIKFSRDYTPTEGPEKNIPALRRRNQRATVRAHPPTLNPLAMAQSKHPVRTSKRKNRAL